MLLHVLHASQNGVTKAMIRTVDTDVVVLALRLFELLHLSELWIAFGVGDNVMFPSMM